MEFCEAPAEGDSQLELDGVRVVIDARSASVLAGTEVDYVSGLMGAGFKFNNPNVRHQCACGESFTT
jgi:iron-sulfur cluster insertion protein